MMKRAMMLFLFLLNILVIDIWLSSGMAFIIFYLFTIYFAVGFLGAFLHAKLRQSLLLQLINVFAAFCVGIGIYGYTKYFPNERNFIPSNPFENFLNMCPVALFGDAHSLVEI